VYYPAEFCCFLVGLLLYYYNKRGSAVKKLIYLTLAVLLALAVFGCKTPENEPEKKEDPKTLDPRLVGWWWYTPTFFYNNDIFDYDYGKNNSYGFFQFSMLSKDNSYIYTHGTPISTLYGGENYQCRIYSKGGIIYRSSDDKKLLKYEFHDKWPFDNFYYISTDLAQQIDEIAAEGNIMTFSIFNEDSTIYNDTSRPKTSWALMRFTDYD
jgi:hypothetical protein